VQIWEVRSIPASFRYFWAAVKRGCHEAGQSPMRQPPRKKEKKALTEQVNSASKLTAALAVDSILVLKMLGTGGQGWLQRSTQADAAGLKCELILPSMPSSCFQLAFECIGCKWGVSACKYMYRTFLFSFVNCRCIHAFLM